ncbi:MAG: type II secretion system protein [Cyanobacteria bacterium SIG30]|nr:type II secretion system protein [Cyanobacteria bacterium SIG30]
MSGGGATNSLKAFTLAEVLITLAIIGVVAALTIPSVITNYQNQERATALKRAYSALANTTNLAIKDYGPISSWQISEGAYNINTSRDFIEKYMLPYLRISKDCGLNIDGDCSFDFSYNNNPEVFSLSHSFARFFLADGTAVALNARNFGTVTSAQINIDVNGQKKPNKWGVDIFMFNYFLKNGDNYTGKLVPACVPDDHDNCLFEESLKHGTNACAKDKNGGYCAYLIMQNGWKIPTKDEYVRLGGDRDQYPW